ncbi:MAG TPA: hypothetical protein VK988_05420 [Acidimicrobiales bacterium]|nr:hypothetical protein [Acidimicrobiales bacterium]
MTLLLGFAFMGVGVTVFLAALMAMAVPRVSLIGMGGGLIVFCLGLLLVVWTVRSRFAGRFAGPSLVVSG